MFHGLTRQRCCAFAYQYAVSHEKKIPASWTKNESAGFAWFSAFVKRRQNLALRLPEATSLARAISFNKFNVDLFFSNLETVFLRQHIPPHRIFNLDETGLTTAHKCKKVISQKGLKHVGQITSAERGILVTLCCCVNAAGQSLPPVYVFPRKHFKDHMLHGAPADALRLAVESGWMNSDLFVETFKHFLKFMNSSKDNPTLLVMDNHKSHLSIKTADIAKENGISIVTFPPHCSHRLQSLDLSVFGPLKSYYNSECSNWMLQNPGTPITIYQVAALSGKAYLRSLTPLNITSRFQKAGIFPFDKNTFADSDFLPAEVTNQTPIAKESGNAAASDQELQESCPDNADEGLPLSHQPVLLGSSLHASESSASSAPVTPRPTTSSVNRVTPEQVRPYPKALPRKSKSNRKRMKSAIITDSPVKQLLFKTRLPRPQTLSKKTKGKKQLKFLRRPDSESSSESEENILCNDTSEGSSEDFSSEENAPIVPRVGDYVIVVFNEKRILHYVGKIVSDKDEDGDFEISFLRRHAKGNGFVEPPVEDIHSVACTDIVSVLPFPCTGTTKRTGGIRKFSVDLSAYNL